MGAMGVVIIGIAVVIAETHVIMAIESLLIFVAALAVVACDVVHDAVVDVLAVEIVAVAIDATHALKSLLINCAAILTAF